MIVCGKTRSKADATSSRWSDDVIVNIALNKIRWDTHDLWHIFNAHFTLQYSYLFRAADEIKNVMWQ